MCLTGGYKLEVYPHLRKIIPPMTLSDTSIKNAKPKLDKPNGYKIPDEKGMYVLIHGNGGKYFRLKYRINGKEKVLALGTYPETSLKKAREKRDIAKKQISDGIDPSLDRKIKKTGATENSFKAVALEWYETKMTDKSDSHRNRNLRLFERDLFPWIGAKPIAELKAPELLLALRRVEGRSIETAHRALQLCGQVFR